MMNIERFQANIFKNILFDFVVLMLQTGLLGSLYFDKTIDFKYVYYGTIAAFFLMAVKTLYLFVMLIKSIGAGKYLLSVGLLFYIFILIGMFLLVVFIGFLPMMGVTTK
jgi:hypothetical protein